MTMLQLPRQALCGDKVSGEIGIAPMLAKCAVLCLAFVTCQGLKACCSDYGI